MGFSTAALNDMLDGLTVDAVSLHDGDPGAAGTDNEVSGGGYSRQTPTFNAASSAERELDSDLNFTCTAATGATYFGLWDSTTFLGGFAITGDQAFNSAGEFTLKAGDTKITMANPS